MDAELKAKWVKALRSDEYKQYRGGIGDVSKKELCCLGVGAHVSNPSLELESTEDATNELQKRGFPDCLDKNRNFTGVALNLIGMNDRQEKSFAEIADWIEAHL